MRRLRRQPWSRAMVAETVVTPADLIWPVFVRDGVDIAEPIATMPGVFRHSVDWLPGNSLESDFYGGYKFKAGEVDLDVGALAYVYSGNRSGNTTELYGAATYGPLTAKYSHTVSEDYFGYAGARTSNRSGRNTGYLNLAFAQEIAPKTTLKAAVGYTRFAGDIKALGVPNYVDYSVGAAYDLGDGLSLGAAVVGATKKAFFGDPNKARLIVSLSKTL